MTLEQSTSNDELQNAPTNFISLSPSDIEKICEICEITWKKYFSKPLPGYKGMKVHWNGKNQLFYQLNRKDQIKIIKSAHISKYSSGEIRKQIKASTSEFEEFVDEFIGFNEGNLSHCHGIAHAIRTAIIAQQSCQYYINNFTEFKKMSPRILFCAISASLLHDIGRSFGGDNYDIFGSLSADIAGEILTEVSGFSDEEIGWIKKAIDAGGLKKKDIEKFSVENCDILNERQMIASLMGDAESFEFERFSNPCCDISYTSIKKLRLLTDDGKCPDELLYYLKDYARDLADKISEPIINRSHINYIEFLRNELTALNQTY